MTLEPFATWTLTAVAAPCAVTSLALFVEVAAATIGRAARRSGSLSTDDSDVARTRFAVLVPAHNESLCVSATVAAIREQVAEGDRVLVVADNCSDDTATLARAAGAEVLERTDATHRGKGYALAAGVAVLSGDPPEVLLLLDADVVPPPGSLDRLSRLAKSTKRPVQAIYLLHSQPNAGTKSLLSEFAFLVKNAVRPAGLNRLGLPVMLTGTGIALPWAVLSDISLASGDIVEDMKLGLDLLLAGHPPMLCPDVVLRGGLPDAQPTALTQRTRWEHGHLALAKRYVPRLLLAGLRRFDVKLLATAADLAIPPLALLVAANLVTNLLTITFAAMTHHWLPATISLASTAAIGIAILLSWATHARHIPFHRLCGAPLYILWKVPLYLRFLTGRAETRWVRTER
jgi:cellulose synthase/poly-beta-1,6-N-acetylglucosamine synthase-like glycosyltransferase